MDFDAIAAPLIEKLGDTMDPDNAAQWVRELLVQGQQYTCLTNQGGA